MLIAYDSKIISVIKEQMEIEKLQKYFDMEKRLNVERMHFEKLNPKAIESMTDDSGTEQKIQKTKIEKDLGIAVADDLNFKSPYP